MLLRRFAGCSLLVALAAVLLAAPVVESRPRASKKQLFHGRIRRLDRELRRYGYKPEFNAPFANFKASFIEQEVQHQGRGQGPREARLLRGSHPLRETK